MPHAQVKSSCPDRAPAPARQSPSAPAVSSACDAAGPIIRRTRIPDSVRASAPWSGHIPRPISAASSRVILLAMALKITSCTFIIRSSSTAEIVWRFVPTPTVSSRFQSAQIPCQRQRRTEAFSGRQTSRIIGLSPRAGVPIDSFAANVLRAFPVCLPIYIARDS
jgi:hypothetical protein